MLKVDMNGSLEIEGNLTQIAKELWYMIYNVYKSIKKELNEFNATCMIDAVLRSFYFSELRDIEPDDCMHICAAIVSAASAMLSDAGEDEPSPEMLGEKIVQMKNKSDWRRRGGATS